RTTPEHPFYERAKGWAALAELQVGDVLHCEDGEWRPIERIEDTGQYEEVYNFRLADYHTYFVGGEEWGFSVWAHNSYKLTDEQKDVYARTYAEYINANKEPDWNVIAPGLSTRQLRNIRQHAREQGYVTPVRVNEQGHADFAGHYYIRDGKPLDNVL